MAHPPPLCGLIPPPGSGCAGGTADGSDGGRRSTESVQLRVPPPPIAPIGSGGAEGRGSMGKAFIPLMDAGRVKPPPPPPAGLLLCCPPGSTARRWDLYEAAGSCNGPRVTRNGLLSKAGGSGGVGGGGGGEKPPALVVLKEGRGSVKAVGVSGWRCSHRGGAGGGVDGGPTAMSFGRPYGVPAVAEGPLFVPVSHRCDTAHRPLIGWQHR